MDELRTRVTQTINSLCETLALLENSWKDVGERESNVLVKESKLNERERQLDQRMYAMLLSVS